MILSAEAFSETGAVRAENQDAILAVYNEYAGIFAVADGMGGHYKGGMASAIAIRMLQDWWERIQDRIAAIPFFDVIDLLEKLIRLMNQEIYRAYCQEGKQGGTTFCLLFVQGDSYAVFNVGDSRLYYYTRRNLRQISVDDVWENQPDIRGLAETVDLKSDPRYGKLTKALGVLEQTSVSLSTGALEKEGIFFLCSDGIYKYYREKELAKTLKRARKPVNAAKALERLKLGVYKNGAQDNLSAILVLAGAGSSRVS